MNRQELRHLIEEALKDYQNTPLIKEAEVTAGPENTKFTLRTGVNKNPTKLGIKIQFSPAEGIMDNDVKSKLEVALQEKLNDSLKDYDIQVSKDTDVPREDVIGFFIPLAQIKNLIVQGITGKSPQKPSVSAPEPSSKSKPTSKPTPKPKPTPKDIDAPPDDKGLDELKENGMNNGKKYLMYLVKHNIM